MQQRISRKYILDRKIDFIDFGASKAASLEYGKDHFFGMNGLGLDLDTQRVKEMKKTGYECEVADLTRVKLPPKSVKFIKMAHILEHMPDIEAAEKVVDLGSMTATDFLVITGPYFDADEYLAGKGLKFHWSDYPDHPCHLKVSQLIDILDKLKFREYEIYLRYPITESSSEHVHPLGSPPWSHNYDPRKHPKKKHVIFEKTVWVDFVCYVKLRKLSAWEKITTGYKHQIPYAEVRSGKKTLWPDNAVNRFIILDRSAMAEEQRANDELDRANMLQSKVDSLKNELAEIRGSTSGRVTRNLRRSSFAIRHPRETLKKTKQKLIL